MSNARSDVLLSAFGVTHVGMVRTNNEDTFIISDLTAENEKSDGWYPHRPVGERGVLLAVSDGMGGAAAGEIASAITVESIKQWLGEEHSGINTDKLIQGAVEEANKNVFDAAQDTERKGMGATLTAILVRGNVAYVAEVGDSRAYLIRGGRIRQVTRDQSYVQMLVEQGMITRDQAESSPYKNVILQAMGQRLDVVVALCRLELRRGDRFLLCSDGLSGKVNDLEMRELLDASETFEAGCRRLIALANHRGGEDNVTVVVAEVVGDGLAVATQHEHITQTLSALREFDLANRTAVEPEPPKTDDSVPSHVTQILTVPAGLDGGQATATAAAPSPAAAPVRVPIVDDPPAASPAPGGLPWLWIAIVGVVLAVAAAVVVYLLL